MIIHNIKKHQVRSILSCDSSQLNLNKLDPSKVIITAVRDSHVLCLFKQKQYIATLPSYYKHQKH